jgi:hypothetical protein
MHNFNRNFFLVLVSVVLFFVACNRAKSEREYGVVNKRVQGSTISKTRLKTEAQYLAILSTDLTQLPISPLRLNRAIRVLNSIGDRETANEIIISNYMNSPDIKLPEEAYMRQQTEVFVRETFVKFFVRYPSEAEVAFFVQFIKSNPEVTVEMVYTAFAASTEYMYY